MQIPIQTKDMPEEISFGDWLRKQRRALDLSQQVFADQVGCAEVNVRRIEAGTLKPSKELASLLLEKVGIPETERSQWISFARGVSGLPGHSTPSLNKPITNLPAPLTTFIGREKEQADVSRLIAKHRLVTLTGSGGVGKTRLCLELAGALLKGYPDGVWFVDLAPLSDPERLPQAISAALGLQEPTVGAVGDALLDFLSRRRLLLLLDNCEHLLEACARLAGRALQACPQLRLLATSREALGIPGEAAFHLPSLSVPDPAHLPQVDQLSAFESVLLFAERAASADPKFALTEHNAAAVAQICCRLDGIPLSLELAAARVRVLAPEQIAARLDDRFRLLTSGSRGALPRQQTLRASIDWSYSLLTEPERILFRRLSVFTGGWSLEAAEQVCADEGPAGAAGALGGLCREYILDLLASLVDKSLVIKQTVEGEARYRRLETVRQYAREKLMESGEAETLNDCHLLYFTSLAEEAAPALWGKDQISWLNRLEEELENIRVALGWSLASSHLEATNLGMRLATALERFWKGRGYWREARDWLAKMSEGAEIMPVSTLIFSTRRLLADFESEAGNFSYASTLYQECLSFAQNSGNKQLEAYVMNGLGLIEHGKGHNKRAQGFFTSSLEIFRQIGDLPGIAQCLNSLGGGGIHRGDYTKAETDLQENLSICLQMGHPLGIAEVFTALGTLEFFKGNSILARDHFVEALLIYRQAGDKFGIFGVLQYLAEVEEQDGEMDLAREHLHECLHLAREINYLRGEGSALKDLGQLARATGEIHQAKMLLREAIEIFRRIYDTTPKMTTAALGFVYLDEGDLSRAAMLFIESLKSARQDSWVGSVAICLFGLAAWSGASGDWDRGTRWLGSALPHLGVIDLADRLELERFQASARQALGEEEYQAALEAGAQLGLDRAVAEALDAGTYATMKQG